MEVDGLAGAFVDLSKGVSHLTNVLWRQILK